MLTLAKQLWRDASQGGAETNENDFHLRELVYFVNTYSILAFLSLGVFGTLHILVEHNPWLGALELSCGSIIALNMLALRATKNIAIGFRICRSPAHLGALASQPRAH